MDVNIQVTGLEAFIKKAKKTPEQIEGTLNRGIKKGIFYLQREAIPRTNVDTGVLRNSYAQKFGRLAGTLYNTRAYGVFVHEGTIHITGNPFLSITAKKEAGKVNKIMNKEMERYLAILQ